jgi:hypothetical protein
MTEITGGAGAIGREAKNGRTMGRKTRIELEVPILVECGIGRSSFTRSLLSY